MSIPIPSLTDIVLILILVGFVGAGFRDGFIRAFGRLAGVVLGWLAASWWSGTISSWLGVAMPSAWARTISYLLVFFVAAKIVSYVIRVLDGMYHVLSVIPFLKSINSALGGFLGFFEGLIMVGAGMYVLMTFRVEPHLVSWLSGSGVAGWIRGFFRIILGLSFS